MGVALGAVADDRDGLAVERVEVCVVVVEHGPAGYIRVGQPSAGRSVGVPTRAAELLLQRHHVVDVLLRVGVQPVLLDRRQPLVVAGRGHARVAAGLS